MSELTTAPARTRSAPRTPSGLSTAIGAALRFAWRDLRVVLFDYKVLVLSIAIGVAAVTGVAALSDSFLFGLARDGRTLVGGDLSLARAQEPISNEERRAFESEGTLSVVASTRAMVFAKGETALADIRAVEANYPLAGAIRTTPAVTPARLDGDGQRGALLDPALLARLGLSVGDTIRIGNVSFVVRAAIDEEPDRLVAGSAFAPRLIVTRAGLDDSKLLTPEALVRWFGKLALFAPDGKPVSDRAVTAAAARIKERLPQSGFEIRTRTNASPQIERIVDRITKFLVAMGLLSVVVGGIGVWNAVALLVERQRKPVAILKTLGASGSFVFGFAMTEVLLLATCGVVLGVLAGTAMPFLFAPFLVKAGVGVFEPILSARSIVGGMAVGFGAALVFAIVPVGRIHDVPGALLLRDDDGALSALRSRYRALAAVALVLFVGAIGTVAGDWRFAAAIVGAALGLAALFSGIGQGLAWVVRKFPRPHRPIGGLAWSGLSRTSRMSRAVIVSLGVGLIVLAATSVVTASFRAQLTAGFSGATPNLFLVGLPSRDTDRFRAFLREKLPDNTVEEAPLLRGRIVEVAGVSAENVATKDGAAWVLEGDRGITYARTLPRDATLVAGQWWPADYDGPPLVSLGADAARGLGIGIGDEIAVNIAGRRVAAKVANLREINWASFGINFVLVFSPSPIEAAPHSTLLTVAAPTLDGPAQNAAFIKALSADWPTVIAIDVHAMLEQAKRLVDNIGLAVQASAGFTMLAAAVVVAGAVAADGRTRARTNTILKIVGGTRRQLVFAAGLEFAILGLLAGVLAIGGGSAAAWAVLHWVLGSPVVVSLAPLGGLLAAAVVAIVLFGLIGNWRVLNEPPSRVMRRM